MTLSLVPKEAIPVIWPAMEPMIAEVIDTRGQELAIVDVFQNLVAERNQLWLYGQRAKLQAWAITSISTYAAVKRLRLILLGGENIDEWLQHVDAIEQWALAFGCTEAEAWVRPGLRKKLERFGYEKAYEVVVKKISQRMVS
jgi:hypothetical protein